jgi:serine/threonine protein kinase
MGVVYKAQDLKLDRPVALKFLPPELTRDPEAKLRFTHEAKAASALDHPNICVVHEIDETADEQIFICMGYYEGETLKKKLERTPLPINDAIGIALQVARGLQAAHEAGMVHRDVKPANIIVTAKGEAKILDFGLAKLAGQAVLTKTGSAVGTTAYASPEQTRGEEVDRRSDIFSFGVVLYEMITGQRPFRGEHEAAAMYSITNEAPEPLARYKAGVSEELQRMIEGDVRWNWTEAERQYKLAIELNPNYPTAHQWYSTFLIYTGRPDEALVEVRRAHDLDPLSLIINSDPRFEALLRKIGLPKGSPT